MMRVKIRRQVEDRWWIGSLGENATCKSRGILERQREGRVADLFLRVVISINYLGKSFREESQDSSIKTGRQRQTRINVLKSNSFEKKRK